MIIGRRRLLAIVVLAALLHVVGIARTVLPAQDGLKFIRVARHFQEWPAIDVVRGSDRHPLYPALVALAEPLVAWFTGPGPDTWRIAAQGVAALASMALLFPLFALARALFEERIAALAVLLFVVLPLPAEVGRDTLSDSLGLLATLAALQLGAVALESDRMRVGAVIGCGVAAGLGYLARPEVALVPLAVGIMMLVDGRWRPALRWRAVLEVSTLSIAFLSFAGAYAVAKGELSEKLALRYGMGMAGPQIPARLTRPWLPPGLDDPHWDFSPKEETLTGESRAPAQSPITAPAAVALVITRWAEGLGGFLGLFAIWGAVRARFIRTWIAEDPALPPGRLESAVRPGLRGLLTVYMVLYALALVRHLVVLGYLSDRHLLPLVAVSLPWTAAGMCVCAWRIAAALGWPAARMRRVGFLLLVLVAGMAVALPQWKPGHRSRWGHWAAGGWLRTHAGIADAVLDTRGWASFASNRPSYDYWHVRQALTDPYLAYIVVGADELSAASRRAATLRAVLAYSAIPVAAFPDDQDGEGIGVLVYRYHRPASWEGLRP